MALPVPLTTDELRSALPEKLKKSINQTLIDQINQTLSDPEMYETYRDNLLSYGRVMAAGRFKIQNYLDAVKYVSFKLGGRTNTDAYALTFPEKIKKFALQAVAAKDIASYTTAYNKSKLVNLLYEQTMVPFWVLNQDLRQKALNTQADLMLTADSEKVRTEAANSVLTHTKAPETQQVEINISTEEDSSITALRKATLALAAKATEALEAGTMTAEEVAHAPITIEGEVITDD